MHSTLAQPATTASQQCHIVCFEACRRAPAASLNPTYTYGAQKEGSMLPPPAPSISALQVSTTRRSSSVCQGLCTILQDNAGLADACQECCGWQSRLYMWGYGLHPWDDERPCIMCELLLSGTTGNMLPHSFHSQLASRMPDSQHASACRPPPMPGA